MSTALVTRSTSRVEHLAVWAYDREQPDAWQVGRYVPLCSQERNHDRWHIVEWTQGQVESAKRKRLCSRCRAHVAALTELAARRTPAESS